jgi:small-conductance mechanosensitive channel
VIAGVATAFAARDLLGNMLSGIAIQFSRPFSVGDYITVSLPFFV